MITDIRREFPYTSFPIVVTEESLPEGIAIARIVNECTTPNSKSVAPKKADFDGSVWSINMTCVPMTEDEIQDKKRSDHAIAKATESMKIDNLVIDYNGLYFQADPESLKKMTQYVVIFDKNDTIKWKLANNTIADFTPIDLQAIIKQASIEISNIKANILNLSV